MPRIFMTRRSPIQVPDQGDAARDTDLAPPEPEVLPLPLGGRGLG
jgi:hypothetical protein